MFKEGQKVWCSVWGWGKVAEVEDGDDYPFYVEFNDTDNCSWFSKEGKFDANGPRCLFFDEVIPSQKALTPPIEYPELKFGDVILIKNDMLYFVIKDSDKNFDFVYISKEMPKSIDDAYDGVSLYKTDIKKVLGNIND